MELRHLLHSASIDVLQRIHVLPLKKLPLKKQVVQYSYTAL